MAIFRKKAVEQPKETKVKVIRVPPEETIRNTIEGLRDDIREQYHIQTDIARVGFYVHMNIQGITELPKDLSDELLELIYKSASRYPFAIAPTEITGLYDGNTWLETHPIPTGYEDIEPYEDFLDELRNLELNTRYNLMMDTMQLLGHSNDDVIKIENIGKYGHINVTTSPYELLKNSDNLSKEEFDHLRQTAIAYFRYRHVWIKPTYVQGFEDTIFIQNIINYFNRDGNSGGGSDSREERELIDELNHLLDDGCRV